MIALKLDNISFGYEKNNNIVDDVCLGVEKGSIVAISGDSGCGKSTLALIMCGVIPKSVHGYLSGDVIVFDKNIKDNEIFENASDISMVFQDPEAQLFSSNVMDEIAFAPENLCYEQGKIIECIKMAFECVGIKDLLQFSSNRLSGGQQQLVALASILSLDPNIIILDEVTSQIDKSGTKMIEDVVKSLKAKGKTIIIIDHKGDFSDLYDKEYCLENGKLEEI